MSAVRSQPEGKSLGTGVWAGGRDLGDRENIMEIMGKYNGNTGGNEWKYRANTDEIHGKYRGNIGNIQESLLGL